MASGMCEIMETSQRGMVDYAFLGGAQIDAYLQTVREAFDAAARAAGVERILYRHTRMHRYQVGEAAGKAILRAYDFNILPAGLAETSAQAVEIAERIGYPVVLKISSPDIIHKSDFGGVRINLANAEQVRDAFDLMMVRIQRRAPDAHIRGGFVEKMGTRGREVILGMTRDPQFGPMLMFGLGGIFVEVMKDVTFHLAPITAEEAMQMLKGTRSYALLKGARGQAPVDLQAIASALQRISQLTGHMQKNKHDYSSRQGLMKMLGRRKSLLSYLKDQDRERYQTLISKLGTMIKLTE